MIIDYPINRDGTMKMLRDDKYYFFDLRTPTWKVATRLDAL